MTADEEVLLEEVLRFCKVNAAQHCNEEDDQEERNMVIKLENMVHKANVQHTARITRRWKAMQSA